MDNGLTDLRLHYKPFRFIKDASTYQTDLYLFRKQLSP